MALPEVRIVSANKERQEVKMLCENSCRIGEASPIINPSCHDAEAELTVKVRYNEAEKQTYNLCRACADVLRKDAHKHGYKVFTKSPI